MRKEVVNILKILFLSVLYVSSFFFIYSTYKLNVLNNVYFSIILIFIIGMDILIGTKLMTPKSSDTTKIIFIVVSVILTIFYVIGYIYITNTREFIIDITDETVENKVYNVVVLKNSNFNDIKDLDNTKMGYMNGENQIDRKINVEFVEYQNVGELMLNLTDGNIKSAIIADEYLEILKENDSELIDNIKIIYTYKIATDKEEITNVIIPPDPFVLYISGSDSRGTVHDTARSDVNIIAVVNPKVHKILLVSIPRDTYVQLHGTTGTKDKLTHAGVYGINKSITTIEDFLNIHINHYLKVSFNTVIQTVDLIDGIDIYSDKDFIPWTEKACPFKEGIQHVNGKCALAFARERKTYTTGDRHRGENQEQVLTKILEKIINPRYLLKYNEILNTLNGSFETSMSYEEITAFIKEQLNTLAKWEVESYNVDGSGTMAPTYSMGARNLYVMIPDEVTVQIANQKINEYLNLTNN